MVVRRGPGRGAGPSGCAASGRATCRPRRSIPCSRWSGPSAGPARLGAAWQAKFHRLAALILLGGAGLVVCVTFVWFSAPDLALTQLLVEVVTTVLLLLGLRWLPKRFEVPGTRAGGADATTRRLRDLAIAVAAGGGLAALSYAVMTRPSARHCSRALPGARLHAKAAAPTSST